MIYWPCKRCAEGLEAPECLAGERLRCPKCKRLCRVPEVVKHHEAEVALVAAEQTDVTLETSNGIYDEVNGDAAHIAAVNGHAEMEPGIVEQNESPADFAIDRMSDQTNAEPSSPEVPDSIAADEPEPVAIEAAVDRMPRMDVAGDIEPTHATDVANEVVSEPDAAEMEITIERVAVNGQANGATMDDLIADAMDRELAEHPPVNGTHDELSETAEAEIAAEPEAASVAIAEIAEELTPEQVLERSLEELTPLIQRQLGPAVAQYSSREQARSAMFARAVVDVFPTRLSVRSHEGNRIVLAVRYRRILRRTMVGTKNLPDLTVEVSFVNDAGAWTLERWQRIVSV